MKKTKVVDLSKVKEAIETSSEVTISKKKKKKAQITDEKTAKAVKEKITRTAESMYIYPEDATSLPDKKKFRTNARSKKAQWIKAIEKAENEKEKAKLIRDARQWASEIYGKSSMPKFG